MGYDVSLRIDTGNHWHKVDEPRFSLSYLYDAVLMELFDVLHFRELDEKQAGELEPMIDKAISELMNHPDKYEIFISKKNDCSIDQLQEWLSQLLSCCQDHPKCMLFIY